MAKTKKALAINAEEKKILEKWIRAKTSPQRIVHRAKICLLAAEGNSTNKIAKALKTTRPTVEVWRKRFSEKGCLGIIEDASHGKSHRRLDSKKEKAIIEATLHSKPHNATHWSTRMMAKQFGVGKSTIQRIWEANGLQPHRIKTFKLSKDKRFVEKMTDVVGVYLNPPDKAMVFCVDEKTQIQALDRTQPGLPIKKWKCQTMTHDYKRNGTTCLFAALNYLQGTVIGTCYPRHRNIEFLKFLRLIDKQTPNGFNIHLILDNYGTHNHPNVKAWLNKHVRFSLHFTPTGSSWLNLVERFFGEITRKQIRRGVFKNVAELTTVIENYIKNYNEEPKPFVWTKSADDILRKVNRCIDLTGAVH